MNDDLQYIHVTGSTSSKKAFTHEQSTGFDQADQSWSQAMHCWIKFGDEWKIVARHSARFLPH